MWFSTFFHDKRQVSGLFTCWGAVVFLMFWYCGVFNSDFVHFGPSDKVKFLNFSINTWFRWNLVAGFCILDSAIWAVAYEAIHPWEINTVLDPKTHQLPYSKAVCLLVLEAYYLHGVLIGPFAVWMSLTQFDLALLKGGVTMLMRTFSHYQYIKEKKYDGICLVTSV
jgi:hypothetical protein